MKQKGQAKGSKHKHLGGKGLSLTAFANAKTKTAYNPSQIRKQREHYKNAKKVKKYRKLVKQLEKGDHCGQVQIDRSALEVAGTFDLQSARGKSRVVTSPSRPDPIPFLQVDQQETTAAKVKEETFEQQHHQSYMNDNEQGLLTFNGRVNQNHKFGSYKRNKNKNTLEKLREVYEKKQEEEEKLRKEREAALAAKREAREKAESKRKDIKSKMYKKTQSGQPVMKYRLEHLLDTIQRSNQ